MYTMFIVVNHNYKRSVLIIENSEYLLTYEEYDQRTLHEIECTFNFI